MLKKSIIKAAIKAAISEYQNLKRGPRVTLRCPHCKQALDYRPDLTQPFCKACGHKIDPDTIRKEEAEQVCVWCGLREEDTGFLHSMYHLKSGIKMGLCDRCAVAFGLSILGLHMNDGLLKDALIGAYGHIVKEQWKKHAIIKDQEQVQADL